MTRRQEERYALPGDEPTDEDLEHEVELARRELSDTVAELVARMNVKARVEEATHRQVDRAQVWVRQRRAPLLAGGVALAVTALVIVLIRRR